MISPILFATIVFVIYAAIGIGAYIFFKRGVLKENNLAKLGPNTSLVVFLASTTIPGLVILCLHLIVKVLIWVL